MAKTKKPSELAGKRLRFVDQYMIDRNGSAAARRAGYSAKTARVTAQDLLADPLIKKAIEEREKKLAAAVGVTAEKVVRELALIGFANMQDYITIADGQARVDLSTMSRDQAAAIQEITTTTERIIDADEAEEVDAPEGSSVRVIKMKFKLADKRAALVDLGKHLGIFKSDGLPPGAVPVVITAIETTIVDPKTPGR